MNRKPAPARAPRPAPSRVRSREGARRTGKATIKDIARSAGVSIATVSYVLNQRGSVGDAVRNRVLEIARELGYTRNQSAQAMRTGRTNTLGLILPDLCNPFFPELAQAVENVARSAGYATLLVDSRDRQGEREGLEKLNAHGVDGIVWCPATGSDAAAEVGIQVPIVVIDRPMSGYDTVSSDYESGGKLLAAYVTSKRYRTLGLITGPRDIRVARLRRDHFVSNLTSATSISWEVENPFSIQLTEQTIGRVREAPPVSAIVCGNDMIAIGAMRLVQELGIAIPRQVAILGFDDIPWAALVSPPLTTVHQPIAGIGREAVSLLLRRIENPDGPRRRIRLEVSLMPRGSTDWQRRG